MKFTAFDSRSRVMESIQQMSTNQIPSNWDIDLKRYLEHSKGKHHTTSDIEVGTSILPALNVKHHPKTLASIHSHIDVGPLKDVRFEASKAHPDGQRRGNEGQSGGKEGQSRGSNNEDNKPETY